MKSLEPLKQVLVDAPGRMKLEDAYKKAGFTEAEIYQEIHGSSMLGGFIEDIDKRIKKAQRRGKKPTAYIKLEDKAFLALLKTKADHKSLSDLWTKWKIEIEVK